MIKIIKSLAKIFLYFIYNLVYNLVYNPIIGSSFSPFHIENVQPQQLSFTHLRPYIGRFE